MIEETIPPESSPPLHFHHHDDELFYLLDGVVTVEVDGNRFTATPGSTVYVLGGPQILVDGVVEKSRVAVVYVEFDDDGATDLRQTSYVVSHVYTSNRFRWGVGRLSSAVSECDLRDSSPP